MMRERFSMRAILFALHANIVGHDPDKGAIWPQHPNGVRSGPGGKGMGAEEGSPAFGGALLAKRPLRWGDRQCLSALRHRFADAEVVIEMTDDHRAVIPILATALIGYVISSILSRELLCHGLFSRIHCGGLRRHDALKQVA